jgi:transmembrane sensor
MQWDEAKQPMSESSTRLLIAAVAMTTLSGAQFVGDSVHIGYVATGVGELRSINLGDGSVITLNTDSSIKTQAEATSLHIEVLRGEVLFSMLPSPTRHLVVSAGDLDIFDTATVFDVRLTGGGQVRVMVEEGAVRLSSGHLGQIALEHNQQAIGDVRSGVMKLRKDLSTRSIEHQLSWREGRLVFECTRLSDVAHEFNRYNLTKLQVDARIENVQIGGQFSATDVIGFVELMPRLDATIHWERTQNAQGMTVLKLYQPTPAARAAKHSAQCDP